MREIKFRAWLKENKWMIYMDDGYVFEFFGSDFYLNGSDRRSDICYNKDEVELMDFTGLYDKNGKEIYAGDIVSGWGGTQISEVFFDTKYGCWAVIIQTSGVSKPSHKLLSSHLNQLEIVGNIYENPELINEKN